MGAKAIVAMLPTAIKEQMEREAWHDYLARCARITTQNSAAAVGGQYVNLDYDEMIRPKATVHVGAAKAAILAKLR